MLNNIVDKIKNSGKNINQLAKLKLKALAVKDPELVKMIVNNNIIINQELLDDMIKIPLNDLKKKLGKIVKRSVLNIKMKIINSTDNCTNYKSNKKHSRTKNHTVSKNNKNNTISIKLNHDRPSNCVYEDDFNILQLKKNKNNSLIDNLNAKDYNKSILSNNEQKLNSSNPILKKLEESRPKKSSNTNQNKNSLNIQNKIKSDAKSTSNDEECSEELSASNSSKNNSSGSSLSSHLNFIGNSSISSNKSSSSSNPSSSGLLNNNLSRSSKLSSLQGLKSKSKMKTSILSKFFI